MRGRLWGAGLVLVLLATPARAQLSDPQVTQLTQALLAANCPDLGQQGPAIGTCFQAFTRLLVKTKAEQKAAIADAVTQAKANAAAQRAQVDAQAAAAKTGYDTQATLLDGAKTTLGVP